MTHTCAFWIRQLESAEERRFSLQSVVVGCEVSLSRLRHLKARSPAAVMFWKVVETLGGGASLEEVGHRGEALRF